jgi:hypothetical protein
MIAKTFGIAKTFRAYSANFLPHAKRLRDHGQIMAVHRVAGLIPTSRERADEARVPSAAGPGWKVTQPRPGWHQWDTRASGTPHTGPKRKPV